MRNYTPKMETNYEYPYKLMLHDIREEIECFKKEHKYAPVYIIINPDDITMLRHEMTVLKLLPQNHDGGIEYLGIRIIRSEDMSEGNFDVVGS